MATPFYTKLYTNQNAAALCVTPLENFRESEMLKKQYDHLRMIAESSDSDNTLTICVASGHADFKVLVSLTKEDNTLIKSDS